MTFCDESFEYKLRLDTPNVPIILRTKLAKSMPVVTYYEDTKAFEKLEQSVTNHNFVIYEASEIDGFPVHQVENMQFIFF